MKFKLIVIAYFSHVRV